MKEKYNKNEYNKKYYLKNKEDLNIASRKDYYKNHERYLKYHKKYALINKELIREKQKIYNQNKKEEISLNKKKYFQNNKDIIYKYRTEKRHNDIRYKLNIILRGRLTDALKGNYKKGSAVRDLGCTITELKVYIELKFKKGMTWENWSLKGWHIDHIKPLASFDLTDRKQLLKAVHYTNLQPLWAKENISKGKKIICV